LILSLVISEVSKLQETYTKLSSEKDAIVDGVKAAGLGLMKSVLNSADDVKDEL